MNIRNALLLWSTVYLSLKFYVEIHNSQEKKVDAFDLAILSIGISFVIHMISAGQV